MISFCDIDGRVGFKQLWDLIDWDKQKLVVSRIQARIVKAVISTNVCCEINCRVFSYTLSMLEPYAVKVSRTVLGGLGTGNSPRLPDTGKADRKSRGVFCINIILCKTLHLPISFWLFRPVTSAFGRR